MNLFVLGQDYMDYVQDPMDFNTIKSKLAEATSYTGPQEFVSDIRLVLSNSRLYNGRGSEVKGKTQS